MAAGSGTRRCGGCPVKRHPRTMVVQRASAELGLLLLHFQDTHDLTDAEMLTAIDVPYSRVVKGLLRAERHPTHDAKADEECDRRDCHRAR